MKNGSNWNGEVQYLHSIDPTNQLLLSLTPLLFSVASSPRLISWLIIIIIPFPISDLVLYKTTTVDKSNSLYASMDKHG